jgi:hypothetical protein
MKPALLLMLAIAILALPGLAQEPAPKPETPKPEAKTAEAAPAEPLPALDQILDKYVETLGGKAALEKITSRQISGSFEIPAMGAKGTVKGLSKVPDKTSMTLDIPDFGVVRMGFDGTVAWGDDPMGGLREITGDELAATKRDADFHRDVHLKTLFPTMTVKSREKVGEKEAYVIEAIPKDGKAEKLFFDVKSGLLVRHDAERQDQQGISMVELYFEDYREIDGIKIPFTIRRVTPAIAVVIKLDEVKQNVEIEDSTFSKPAPK